MNIIHNRGSEIPLSGSELKTAARTVRTVKENNRWRIEACRIKFDKCFSRNRSPHTHTQKRPQHTRRAYLWSGNPPTDTPPAPKTPRKEPWHSQAASENHPLVSTWTHLVFVSRDPELFSFFISGLRVEIGQIEPPTWLDGLGDLKSGRGRDLRSCFKKKKENKKFPRLLSLHLRVLVASPRH